MTMNRKELLNYFYDKVDQESYTSLSNWTREKTFNSFQALTIYSNKDMVGYVIRNNIEYFIMYNKEEN